MRSPRGGQSEPGARLDSINLPGENYNNFMKIYFKEILIRLRKLSLEIHLTKITEGKLILQEGAIFPEDSSNSRFDS